MNSNLKFIRYEKQKKKIAKFLKFGALLFGISLSLWNCENEDKIVINQTKQVENKKISTITFNKLPENVLNTISEINPSTSNKKENNFNLLEINQEQIIKIVDSLKNVSYSLKFTLKNTPENILYNLILATDKNNIAKEPYILKYTIDNLKDIKTENTNINFSKMKGIIERYSYQSFINNLTTTFKSKSSYYPCDTYDYDGYNPIDNSGDGSDIGIEGGGGGTSSDCRAYVWSSNDVVFAIDIVCGTPNDSLHKTTNDCGTLDSGGSIGINSGEKICVSGYTLENGNCVKTECPQGYSLQNGECVLDDKIAPSELTGKAECLNDKLTQNGNTFVKDILSKFQGISEFNINIKSVDKVFPKGTTTGDGLNGKTRHTPGSSLINIEISTSKLSTMPALAAVRTLIHEYIHADMYRKLYTKYATKGDLDFRKTYQEF
ncbi:hypothetical protein [Tenacibaculum sp.]|uniref:hypothetical protein n=1 Tax=Tenacibaculum sp. TaxID=1906242 RepID=UPI003AA8BA25